MDTPSISKRRWPRSLWIGFLLGLAAAGTFPFFARFPVTRDFAWPTFLLLLLGAFLLAAGLGKAFRQPALFRGQILGSILALVMVAALAFFSWGIFVASRVPNLAERPVAGEKAPEFSLPDQTGKAIQLDELIAAPARGALLIFYRGHW